MEDSSQTQLKQQQCDDHSCCYCYSKAGNEIHVHFLILTPRLMTAARHLLWFNEDESRRINLRAPEFIYEITDLSYQMFVFRVNLDHTASFSSCVSCFSGPSSKSDPTNLSLVGLLKKTTISAVTGFFWIIFKLS